MRLHNILVDDREKDPDSATVCAGLIAAGAPAVVNRLDTGDFQWTCEPDKDGEEWGVWIGERKTIRDLISSMPPASDRLTRFFENTGGFDPPPSTHRFLLLEGDQFRFTSWGEREWTPEQVDNLLISLQEKGIMVVRSRGPAETPRRLVALWSRSGRPDRGESILRPSPATASNKFFHREDREAVAFLMGLPGIGEDRAIALLKHFGALDMVLSAALGTRTELLHPDEPAFPSLVSVPGFGKGMAKNIRSFLDRQVQL